MFSKTPLDLGQSPMVTALRWMSHESVQSHRAAAAAVVTWMYNHCRSYIGLLKWTKMPRQQKNT